MNEIDLAFVGKVLLGCGIIAGIAIFWGDIRPWIMSRYRAWSAARNVATVPVHVPVQPNQYGAGGTENIHNNVMNVSADTDAENSGTDWQPRLPRYPTEEELVIYLATVRDRRGKYLRSANKIAEFSELHRNEVLKLVREVREGVPEYPPMPPGGEETRRELALD